MATTHGHVWYAETRVGSLIAGADGLRFRYDRDWLDRGFPISLSLPLAQGEAEVDAQTYFSGLLPEGRARQRITRQLRLRPDDDAALLFAIGRDCAGALSVLPEDLHPVTLGAEPTKSLSKEDLDALVDSRGAFAAGAGDRIRFSLAGAQDKLAVIVEEGALLLPSTRAPSSHILKFETLPWVCFTEWMGTELARRAGLLACEVEYRRVETEHHLPYLRIARYDRRDTDAGRIRLHQEDLTQALGYDSGHKYEQDGGPSLAQVTELIRRHCEDPIIDIGRLRDWQLFNYLVGNSDAHAKNLALLYEPGHPVPRLAPFYDLVCVEFHNRIGATHFDRTMAFFVGDRSLPEEIRRSDWEALARAMRIAAPRMLRRLDELATTLPPDAETLRHAFAAAHGDNPVYDRLVETIRDRCCWVQNNVLVR